jgi:hypothetical protein
MASTSTKSQKLALELSDELRQRVSSYASIVDGFDANGFATISLNDGSAATTEDNVFICVRPRDWNLQKDIVNNTQPVYTPSVIQIAVEAGTGGNASCIAAYVSKAHWLALSSTCSKRGTRVEYWEETNGTVPTITTFNTGTKLIASFEPDLYFPLLSSQ